MRSHHLTHLKIVFVAYVQRTDESSPNLVTECYAGSCITGNRQLRRSGGCKTSRSAGMRAQTSWLCHRDSLQNGGAPAILHRQVQTTLIRSLLMAKILLDCLYHLLYARLKSLGMKYIVRSKFRFKSALSSKKEFFFKFIHSFITLF